MPYNPFINRCRIISTNPDLSKAFVPIAALLGIMAIGFVILEKNNELANSLASIFGKIWVLSEILLFVYIGTEARMEVLDANLIGLGLVILAIGLTARSLGVWLSCSDLTSMRKNVYSA